jgi:propanol-preferring alcohol dehydrogenase
MVLQRHGEPLTLMDRPDPQPISTEVRVRVAACGACRTDLHVVEVGRDVNAIRVGMRVGIPWLGYTCGHCYYCLENRENLCDHPLFTGYTRDGGYATHVVADARYVCPLPDHGDDVATAPLLCAGLIGWRSLRLAGEGERIGLYGFGAAAHIIAQVARWQGRFSFHEVR